MATPSDPTLNTDPSPSANPTPAPASSTPSAAKMDPTQSQPPQSQSQPQAQKAPKPPKPAKQQAPKDKAPADGAAGGDGLSPAELKKRAKAEKAARRAREKADRDQGGAAGGQAANTPAGKKGADAGAAAGQAGKGQKSIPRRGSTQAGTGNGAEAKKKQEDKNVAVFGHLYGQHRRTTVAGAGKEVHPAVLALGLQMRDYVVCGSSARCVATLLAFKRVIQAYTTPKGTSLARHLTTHLSHQITYLSTCRPLSISQGNAIRALKLAISSIDPSVLEAQAKTTLCEFIDSFIREKITVADQVIAGSAAQKIKDGDVVVTFAGSSIVKQTLLTAFKQGKRFRVSIIDSRPLFEGKNLARTLANAGLEVQYSLVSGISHAIKDATKVFLGAHAMTSNGRLYSRVGTALVAMSAKERAGGVEIPVIVCCETVKFTDRVALDSIVVNEIADADELVISQAPHQLTDLPDPAAAAQPEPKKGGKAAPSKPSETESSTKSKDSDSPLVDWRDTTNLQLLNLLYDATPAEYVDMVVTEMGSLPPSAVPIVHRMSTSL
ncbi:translation initiation factor eIF2B subunit delta [Aspergillus undulatus]|uniref:translation initiation factor eIF2B subunit delta n=1 Tax=Aspergillus undulatus TaxID=1810928 RepID=UPI003CCDFEC3